MSLDELWHYLRLGGLTMVFIIASSLLALAVCVERIIALWGASESSRLLSDVVSKHLLRGEISAARTAAERSAAPIADVYLAGFDRLEQRRGTGIESAVERERANVGLRLKKFLWILGTIGAVTPFVGLLGTVVGIMRSFKDLGVDVESGGTGGSAAVMSGISEALIATAAGILVAVEAVIFYNYFQARLARLSVELRLLADEFVETLREARGQLPAVAAPTVAAPPVTPDSGSST